MLKKRSLQQDDIDPLKQIAPEPGGSGPPELNLEDIHIVIVIPAYNEERFIGSVVLKARSLPGE